MAKSPALLYCNKIITGQNLFRMILYSKDAPLRIFRRGHCLLSLKDVYNACHINFVSPAFLSYNKIAKEMLRNRRKYYKFI
jgi:hypothetical protein